MSSLQNMLNYLDEKSLVSLIEELENLFIEKSLTKILYTFLTIKTTFGKCYRNLYRQFDTKIQIYKHIYKGFSQVSIIDNIDMCNNPHYYVLQVIPYLEDIKQYLFNIVLELEDKIKKLCYGDKIYISDINNLEIDVPYHKYILYKYST